MKENAPPSQDICLGKIIFEVTVCRWASFCSKDVSNVTGGHWTKCSSYKCGSLTLMILLGAGDVNSDFPPTHPLARSEAGLSCESSCFIQLTWKMITPVIAMWSRLPRTAENHLGKRTFLSMVYFWLSHTAAHYQGALCLHMGRAVTLTIFTHSHESQLTEIHLLQWRLVYPHLVWNKQYTTIHSERLQVSDLGELVRPLTRMLIIEQLEKKHSESAELH